MTKVLFVLSSVREGRISDQILALVKERFEAAANFEFDVADFKSAPLPFFDSAVLPSQEGFVSTDENVKAWTQQVDSADVVVFLTSENNHSYSAVLKNAVDWIFKEWAGKPVAFIGYGWSGGSKATKELRTLLTGFIQAKPYDVEANLLFTKDIDLSGASISDNTASQIDAVVKAIQAN